MHDFSTTPLGCKEFFFFFGIFFKTGINQRKLLNVKLKKKKKIKKTLHLTIQIHKQWNAILNVKSVCKAMCQNHDSNQSHSINEKIYQT